MKTALAFLAAAASVLFAAFLVPAATDSDSEGLPDADSYVQTSSFHETRPSVGLGGKRNRERLLSLYDREAMGGMDFEEWFRLAGADEEGILCRAEADCEWINPDDPGLACRAHQGTKIEVGTFYSDPFRSLILDYFLFGSQHPWFGLPEGGPTLEGAGLGRCACRGFSETWRWDGDSLSCVRIAAGYYFLLLTAGALLIFVGMVVFSVLWAKYCGGGCRGKNAAPAPEGGIMMN